jgi:FkbM family methyltransferase
VTTQSFVRSVAPSGALALWRARRFFGEASWYTGGAWRAALSPRLRRLAETSMLDSVSPELLADPACVVDVGAHVGWWSEAVLDLLNPRRLVAFEPAPEAFRQLEERIGSRPGVELVQAAVGAARGHSVLHESASAELSSLLHVRPGVATLYGVDTSELAHVEVEVVPLDEALADEPEITMLKIDVQGSESAVLAGAADVLRRTRAVLIEANFVSHYRGDSLFVDLDAALRAHQFEFFAFPHLHQTPDRRHLWADAVYVKVNGR